MTRNELLQVIMKTNPDIVRQVESLIRCKSRFCKITMKADPIKDQSRGNKPRTFLVNVRATYDHMMKRHFDSSYSFDPTVQTSAMKARRTCTERAILGVVENANVGGRTVLQYRNVDLKRIASVQCGNIMENFA